MRLAGLGFRLGREYQPGRRPSYGGNAAPLNAPSRCPVARAINSCLRTGAQPKEAQFSNCRTGVRRLRDQRQPRPADWTDDEGLEHSVASDRAACGELSRIRKGSLPSWATVGRADHPSGQARATGTMPPGFCGGKHWKSQTTQPLSPARNRRGIPCEGYRLNRSIEFMKTSTKVHRNLQRPAVPPTSTTTPMSPSV